MPNYWYRCECCKKEEQRLMPLSYNPDEFLYCPDCDSFHMKRIIKFTPHFKIKKETFGEWYKENTGKDLLG